MCSALQLAAVTAVASEARGWHSNARTRTLGPGPYYCDYYSGDASGMLRGDAAARAMPSIKIVSRAAACACTTRRMKFTQVPVRLYRTIHGATTGSTAVL